MKRNFLLTLILFVCTSVFAQIERSDQLDETWEQISVTLVDSTNIHANVGAHKAPTRVEHPQVYISSENRQMNVANSGVCEGAFYRIKDSKDNILLSGTIIFGGEDFYTIELATLLSGNYIVEIETQNFIFQGLFIY